MNTKLVVAVLVGLIVGVGGTLAWNKDGVYKNTIDTREIKTAAKMDHGTMSDSMDSMMGSLDGKTGDAFDQEFINQMIVHHEGAVSMAEAALVHAKHQEIKDLAGEIISAQTKEIGLMKEWLALWYPKAR